MSQRLLVTKDMNVTPENSVYDAVIHRPDEDIKKIIHNDLFKYSENGQFYLGPWKIRIVDIELFLLVQDSIREAFKSLHINFPEDVWCFYCGDNSIEHPNQKELDVFLNQRSGY